MSDKYGPFSYGVQAGRDEVALEFAAAMASMPVFRSHPEVACSEAFRLADIFIAERDKQHRAWEAEQASKEPK